MATIYRVRVAVIERRTVYVVADNPSDAKNKAEDLPMFALAEDVNAEDACEDVSEYSAQEAAYYAALVVRSR